MASDKHITSIETTLSLGWINIEHGQRFIRTDGGIEWCWANDDKTRIYIGAVQGYTTNGVAYAAYSDNDMNALTLHSHLNIEEYIRRWGGTDDHIRFQDAQIDIVLTNTTAMTFTDSTVRTDLDMGLNVTPSKGGALEVDGGNIIFYDDHGAEFGDDSDALISWDNTNSDLVIEVDTDPADLLLSVYNGDIILDAGTNATRVYHDDPGATGPIFEGYHDSASPAIDDVPFTLSMNGNDSADNKTEYAALKGVIEAYSDGVEYGGLYVSLNKAGSPTDLFEFTFDGGSVGYLKFLSGTGIRFATNTSKIEWTTGSASIGSATSGNVTVELGDSAGSKHFEIDDSGSTTVFYIDSDGHVFASNLRSGTTQANAGASAGELWVDTDDSNTVKLGT